MWHTAVFYKYKNAGKQTILIFWSILILRGQICIFELVTLGQKWSLTSVCVLFMLAPSGALVFFMFNTPLQISPQNTSNTFWKYFTFELYFWTSESGKILAFEESESGSEYGACCDPGGPQTHAVLRRWFDCLHNSRRVLIRMMTIIHLFDHHHAVSHEEGGQPSFTLLIVIMSFHIHCHFVRMMMMLMVF